MLPNQIETLLQTDFAAEILKEEKETRTRFTARLKQEFPEIFHFFYLYATKKDVRHCYEFLYRIKEMSCPPILRLALQTVDRQHRQKRIPASMQTLLASILLNKMSTHDVDTRGNSLLHQALYLSFPGVVEHVLNKGVDLEARNHDGQTALHAAIYCDHADLFIMEQLIAKGANIHAHDNQGRTPLVLAVDYKDLDKTKLLLLHGAIPKNNSPDRLLSDCTKSRSLREILRQAEGVYGVSCSNKPQPLRFTKKVAAQSTTNNRPSILGKRKNCI